MTTFVEYQPKMEMKKSPGKYFEPCFVITTRYGKTATVTKLPLSGFLQITEMLKKHPEYLTP